MTAWEAAIPGGSRSVATASPVAASCDPPAWRAAILAAVAKLKPGIAFFRDDAFVDDFARTNLQQVFNHFSPTTSIKVI